MLVMNQSKSIQTTDKPLRMDPDQPFRFKCGPGVPCFTDCCRDVTIVLTPYDVVRLKNALQISSGEFLDQYTIIVPREKRLIPMVVLKMNEDNDKRCQFVSKEGCSVYDDRPWPCRMYPLNMNDDGSFGFIADPAVCKGLEQPDHARISSWLIEQGVPMYDEMNMLFSQVTTPLQAQELDIDNPKIYQMTFMALYNLDKFKDFIFNSSFLDRFVIDDISIEKLKRSDVELLKFAFDWIKFGVFGQRTLQVKEAPQTNDH